MAYSKQGDTHKTKRRYMNTDSSVNKFNPKKTQKMSRVPFKYFIHISITEKPVIIGWYCSKCEVLHRPTQSCPLTNLGMQGMYTDSF